MGYTEQVSQHHTHLTVVGPTAVKILSIPVGPGPFNGPTPNIPGIGIPEIVVQNQGDADVYIGGPQVGVSGDNTGIVLKGGQTVPDRIQFQYSGEIWAITASGQSNVVVDAVY